MKKPVLIENEKPPLLFVTRGTPSLSTALLAELSLGSTRPRVLDDGRDLVGRQVLMPSYKVTGSRYVQMMRMPSSPMVKQRWRRYLPQRPSGKARPGPGLQKLAFKA